MRIFSGATDYATASAEPAASVAAPDSGVFTTTALLLLYSAKATDRKDT